MKLLFIELKSFIASATGVLSDEKLVVVMDELLANPRSGDPIVGTGGVRKTRAALEGRGKRGGARVVYYYVESRAVIYLIVVYAKGVSSTLSAEGKKVMRKLTAQLDKE